jgi:hypothetical protein
VKDLGHEEFQLKGLAFAYNSGKFLILLKNPGPLKSTTMLNGLGNLHVDLFFYPDSTFTIILSGEIENRCWNKTPLL